MSEENETPPRGLMLNRSDGRTVTIDQTEAAFDQEGMEAYRAGDWTVTSKVWRASQSQQITRRVMERNKDGGEPTIDNVEFVKSMWREYVTKWTGFLDADGPIRCSDEEKDLLVEYHWDFAQNVVVALAAKIKETSVGDAVVAKNSNGSGSTGSRTKASETPITAKTSAK